MKNDIVNFLPPRMYRRRGGGELPLSKAKLNRGLINSASHVLVRYDDDKELELRKCVNCITNCSLMHSGKFGYDLGGENVWAALKR